MITDSSTVLWKELRLVLWEKGSLVRGLRSVILALMIFGIVLPWQFGRELIDTPAALAIWIWVPCLMATSVVADAFAGERERHTLETLLSMPLSDAGIFLGKFLAAVLYGWAFTVIAALVAAAAVNVLHPEAAPIFYAPEAFAGMIVFSLLVTGLFVSAGILLALRTPSVRQATQAVSILTLALVLVPAGLSQLAPVEWIDAILDGVERSGPVATASIAAGFLALIDGAILAVGVGRFERARLVAG